MTKDTNQARGGAVETLFNELADELNGRRDVGWLHCGTSRFEPDIESELTGKVKAICRKHLRAGAASALEQDKDARQIPWVQRLIEEKLERAAVECEDVARVESERTIGRPTTGEYQIGCNNCAAAIRALDKDGGGA